MSYYKKVTLKDIANDSGVSVSSVSMILNKREGVSFSNETVERFCPLRKNWDMRFLLPQKEWYTCLQYSKIRKVYCYFLP